MYDCVCGWVGGCRLTVIAARALHAALLASLDTAAGDMKAAAAAAETAREERRRRRELRQAAREAAAAAAAHKAGKVCAVVRMDAAVCHGLMRSTDRMRVPWRLGRHWYGGTSWGLFLPLAATKDCVHS